MRKVKQFATGARRGTFIESGCSREITRVAALMLLYPLIYIVLTLPLSAGRMWSMAHNGNSYSNGYAVFAGCMLTSCGFVDVLLYSLTRRRLLQATGLVAGQQYSLPSASISLRSGAASCKENQSQQQPKDPENILQAQRTAQDEEQMAVHDDFDSI